MLLTVVLDEFSSSTKGSLDHQGGEGVSGFSWYWNGYIFLTRKSHYCLLAWRVLSFVICLSCPPKNAKHTQGQLSTLVAL